MRIQTIIIPAVFIMLSAVLISFMVKGPECGNGQCERGEDCKTCPDCDCPPVIVTAEPSCGDGVCQESCNSCAADCPCSADEYCSSSGCTKILCGDGSCGAGENCANCADCTCPTGEMCSESLLRCLPAARCGDGSCKGESCSTCPKDCPCLTGAHCDKAAGVCKKRLCGNAVCEPGEDQFTCCDDCQCTTADMACTDHACSYPTPAISDEEAEQLAIKYINDMGLSYISTISIKKHNIDGTPAKQVTLKVLERMNGVVIVVTDSKEVILIPTL